MTDSTALACPLDGLPLSRSGNCWRCAGSHSYDIARHGSVNLLPVPKKRSRDPGDSKDMIIARQQFLASGFYQPLADAVCRTVESATDAAGVINVLDAGCGEGYYLRELKRTGLPLKLTGLDISKWAVMAAARRDKDAVWLVGSNANLPLLPATQDLVLCLFGFPDYAEFARVLRPGAVLIKADPGPDHLLELRQVIYPSIKAAAPAPETPDGFTLLEHRSVRYTINLSSQQQISQLLTMTPHLYRATAEGRSRAAALTDITLTVDVRISCMASVP